MSEMTSSPSDLPVLATVACPHCSVVVPDARYCGACGAHLVHAGLRASERLHSYAAFPDEPVFRLSAVTSLFPHLSHRAKAPFRVGFAVFLTLLLIFALAGTSAPLIAVSALSVPLLYLLYIWEVDPYEGSFLSPTLLCLVLGAGLGAGWAIVGSTYVDKALLPSFSPSLTSGSSVVAAVAVPAIGQLLMCVPMVVVRRMQTGPTESLDGFVAGATGALGFTLAATIDLMAPWLSNGQLTHEAFLSNITQVVLRGVTLPLISAMATGFIGMAFWAKTGSRPTGARARWLTSPGVALALALLVQVGLGFTDIAALSDAVLLVIHLVALGVLTLAMRAGLHHVLLHEALDVKVGGPRVCPNCTHLVPAMAFCPQCGVAERATSRRHRRTAIWPALHGILPAPEARASTSDAPPDAPWPTVPPGTPGLEIGFPGAHEDALPNRRLSHVATIALLVACLSVLTVALVVVALLATPGPPAPCPPLQCQGPPTGRPNGGVTGQSAAGPAVVEGTYYKSPSGFSLRYQLDPSVQTTSKTIGLTYPFRSGTAYLDVFGGSSAGTSSEQVVQNFVNQNLPSAQPVYSMPGPLVGYRPGFGEAFNVQPASTAGSTQTERVLVLSSSYNGFGIIVVAYGALLSRVTASSQFFDGHPSPANLNLAYFYGADSLINSIEFP
jgi:predicted amidophosphoribosyltransferase